MELAERPTFDYLTDKLNNLKNKINAIDDRQMI